jgi:hypothetical protein
MQQSQSFFAKKPVQPACGQQIDIQALLKQHNQVTPPPDVEMKPVLNKMQTKYNITP